MRDFVQALRNTIEHNTSRVTRIEHIELFEEIIDGFCQLSKGEQDSVLSNNITLTDGTTYPACAALNHMLVQVSDYLKIKIPPVGFKAYVQRLAARTPELMTAAPPLEDNAYIALVAAFDCGDFNAASTKLDCIAHTCARASAEVNSHFFNCTSLCALLDTMTTKFSMSFMRYIEYYATTPTPPARLDAFIPGNKHYKERPDWESAQESCSRD